MSKEGKLIFKATVIKNGRTHNEYTTTEGGKEYVVEEYDKGTKVWFYKGKRHRENDLPAVEYFCGSKAWYVNGHRYRQSGKPSFEGTINSPYHNKEKFVYTNEKGEKHREDGAAIEYWYGNAFNIKPIYWLNGNPVDKTDLKKTTIKKRYEQ